MEIKLLDVSHAEAYWALRLQMLQDSPASFAGSYEEAIKRPDPIGTVSKRLQDPESHTFGCWFHGQLAGTVTLVREAPLKMRHKASVYAMYVSPAYRGKGVARKLMDAAIALSKEIEGIEQLSITVVTSNESARGLYLSCGFKPYGTEKRAMKYNDEYFDEELMVLFL
ncbi:GNAT family N-acetyltransferase [Bacillus sp. KH172YL63]|uniref:GNAT family N-acetyltransferase n=1 Tax=Bacillus sp. KH172YL63 TaxID=2709784 RepID=UPI0013E44BE0|nr:GNAT family N-acetyltransferase [Bacillus sp. KH172YL63]BCB03746.1 N-acetyltransferase [Bacillus sp. KH172YL63]